LTIFKSTVRCKWNPSKSAVAYIQNTERLQKNNLGIVAIRNFFREPEQTVKSPVSHGLVLNSHFQTRVASVSECVT